jgi:glycosyltransferase involved in cell wall biosynthesis
MPVLVGDIQLEMPLPQLNAGGRYQGARLLIWLHNQPIGEVHLSFTSDTSEPLSTDRLASMLWPLIADAVVAHCEDDGIPAPAGLPPGGLIQPRQPCRTRVGSADEVPITVVIATRDRTESLLRCLASLAKLDYSSFDVVVVDSAPSTETTARTLKESQAWPFAVRYVRTSHPGLALAHNAALSAVTGEIVAITDDDVEVHPAWLMAIAEAFAEPDATCVTGLILPAELQTPAQLLVERAGGYGRGFTRRIFTREMPDPEPLFPFTAGRFGSGANMAFRTAWLVAHGGFDRAMGAGTPARGGDDLTAFLGVIVNGGTLVYEPRAVVRHWHRREFEGMRRQAFGYGIGLGAYFAAALWARPPLIAAMLRRAVPAARHLLDPASVKNADRGAGFPRELVWRERAGVMAGPFAYGMSRWRYRNRTEGPAGVP